MSKVRNGCDSERNGIVKVSEMDGRMNAMSEYLSITFEVLIHLNRQLLKVSSQKKWSDHRRYNGIRNRVKSINRIKRKKSDNSGAVMKEVQILGALNHVCFWHFQVTDWSRKNAFSQILIGSSTWSLINTTCMRINPFLRAMVLTHSRF